MEPKKREAQGKLKECIDNITPLSIEKAKVALELEAEGISETMQ